MKIQIDVMIFKDKTNEFGEIYGTECDEFQIKYPIEEQHPDKLNILQPLMEQLQEFKENEPKSYYDTIYRCGCYKTVINNCKVEAYLYDDDNYEDALYDAYYNEVL